jgi:hypothetical protein
MPEPAKLVLVDSAARASAAAPLEPLFRKCEEIATAAPGETSQITSLFLQMSLTYYSDVRKQAAQSFWSALAAAGVGMLFFLYAIVQAMSQGGEIDSAWIGLLAGVLAQFIAGVNFYLYFNAARQFASFHICLERTDRFLIANTICDQLNETARDEVRRTLIEMIASAPMLSLAMVQGNAKKTSEE